MMRVHLAGSQPGNEPMTGSRHKGIWHIGMMKNNDRANELGVRPDSPNASTTRVLHSLKRANQPGSLQNEEIVS